MNQGVISGGWEFVWAAYGVTATLFTLYAISLYLRIREARKS